VPNSYEPATTAKTTGLSPDRQQGEHAHPPIVVFPARRAGPPALAGALVRASGPALVAVAACLVCYVAGWRGTDWAAQIYRAGQDARYGLSDWDPGWYGGNYPLNYSLFYPLAAAYLGLWPLAALSCAWASLSFDRLVSGPTRRRPVASWYFAVSTLVEVAIGQLPTLTGEALALGCVVCFSRGQAVDASFRSRRRAATYLGGGLLLGVLAGLTSPVAGSFLALALVAMAAADLRRSGRRACGEIAAAILVMTSTAACPLLFPGPGYFPFFSGDLIMVLVICAVVASPVLPTSEAVRAGALLYGAVSIALFIVPTQMGDNDMRLAAYIGVPLVLYYLPRSAPFRRGPSDYGGWSHRRGTSRTFSVSVSALAAACLVTWQWGPMVTSVAGSGEGASSVAVFYQPLIAELDELSKGKPVRIEIPPMEHHWEAVYVAPAFSLARGWERQLDDTYDDIFYQRGRLKPSSYMSWLLANGVSYVALAEAPLDYAATAEAALLRSGDIAGLQPVWRTASWALWRVSASNGLASGPATLTAINPNSVIVRFSKPGVSVVKLRWTPYWSFSSFHSWACLMPAPGGWTEVRTAYPGPLQLHLSVFGPDHGQCPNT
jgi:hypothetical protein